MKTLSLFLISAFLVGCTTATALTRVKPGMSKHEVERIIGRPDGFELDGDIVVTSYRNRYASEFSGDKTDFILVYRNDKLVKLTNTPVRRHVPNNGLIQFGTGMINNAGPRPYPGL